MEIANAIWVEPAKLRGFEGYVGRLTLWNISMDLNFGVASCESKIWR